MFGDLARTCSLSGVATVHIIFPVKVVERLMKISFRGQSTRRAWNTTWRSPEIWLQDPQTCLQMDAEILMIVTNLRIPEEKKVMLRMRLEYERPIGWSSTDDLSRYDLADYEEFAPDKHSVVLRIKSSRGKLKAPRTDVMTVIYELEFKPGTGWVATIQDAYPGNDVGEPKGNVSERENRVFFNPKHAGI